MISPAQLAHTRYWLGFFQDVWQSNAPTRLHKRDLDMDGNPEWTTAFEHWLDGTSGRNEGGEDRARLKKAMQRLRKQSVREYEVVYRVMVLGHSVPEIADWLTERAIKGGHPERYGPREALVIIYAATDKLLEWY